MLSEAQNLERAEQSHPVTHCWGEQRVAVVAVAAASAAAAAFALASASEPDVYANWQNRTRSLIASAECFLLKHFEREEGNSLEAPTRLQSKLPKARVGLFALAEWNAHDCPGATIAMAHEVAVVHVAARVSWLIVGCLMSS